MGRLGSADVITLVLVNMANKGLVIQKLRSTTDQFIQKATAIHNGRYDYSKVCYTTKKIPVIIICPIHGEFKQTPQSHLNGRSCKKCNDFNRRLTTSEFIRRSIEIHKDIYDYSKVVYISCYNPVILICPIHGEFRQRASKHLEGYGCLKCARSLLRSAQDDFILEASARNNNIYDYSQTVYVDQKTDIKVICSIHGCFCIKPKIHLQGHGCQKCGYDKLLVGSDEFIKRAIAIHGSRFDYTKVNYTGILKEVDIICQIHGVFRQTPQSHLNGAGCQLCSVSSGHQAIYNYIKSLYFNDIILNDRGALDGLELDIYLSDLRIGIEYHGLYWHSYDSKETLDERNKHHHKFLKSLKHNIKLFQFFEHEWLCKSSIVKSILLNKLQLSKKIGARKCELKEISNNVALEFYNRNHLQGGRHSSVNYGLFNKGKLISAMSFNPHPKYKWEIMRYACETGITVVGGPSRLFKCFLRCYSPASVLSFADLRYSTGQVYSKLGFILDSYTKPNYFYCRANKIWSRQFFQKHKLPSKLINFDSTLTESANMFNNGYRRVWDAGHAKMVWKSSSI